MSMSMMGFPPVHSGDCTREPRTCSGVSRISCLSSDVMETTHTVTITKIDDERRLFGGWAYIAKTATGEQVVDASGDFVDDEAWPVLKDAAIRYGVEVRAGDDMHQTFGVAKLAELFISDPEKWEQLGISQGVLPQGVFMTFKADDTPAGEQLWQSIKNGDRRALSIVGSGRREET